MVNEMGKQYNCLKQLFKKHIMNIQVWLLQKILKDTQI